MQTILISAVAILLKPLNLSDLPVGVVAEVIGVRLQAADEATATVEDRDILLRLIEIGFVPGEQVRVIAHGYPGREPVAVRIGGTTFALRRFEADLIQVQAQAAVSGIAGTSAAGVRS